MLLTTSISHLLFWHMSILGEKRSGLPSGPSLTGSAFFVVVPGMVCPTLWAEAAAAMTATAMNTVRIGDIADGRTASDYRVEHVARRQFKGLAAAMRTRTGWSN